jgi:surface protein
MSFAFRLPPLSKLKGEGQKGINMVDLMMWLVIAALLLAAALQGINYYQKAAVLHQMQNDLSGAGSNVMAVVANQKGVIDKDAADEGVLRTKFSKEVTPSVEVADGTTIPYLRATHPSVPDKDVIYLFKDCAPFKVGVNIVSKTGDALMESCGISASPAPSGTPTAPATGEPTTPPVTVTPTPTPTPSPTEEPTTPPVVPAAMISEWDTRLDPVTEVSGGDACNVIQLPMNGTVNATIDWGDGTVETVTSAYPRHTYTGEQGIKTVSISGTFTGWVGDSAPGYEGWSSECITKVTKWDDSTATVDGSKAFSGATSLTDVARVPSTITNYFMMFSQARNFNGDISGWDTSNATDMSLMFHGADAFNQPIGGWNVSNVTDMGSMFDNADSFNQPLGSWNVSNVTDFSSMFSYAYSFNQPIGGWNVSKATTMEGMFAGTIFNQNLGSWNTSNVTDMNNMFSGATAFNGDISGWETSKVTSMNGMFRETIDFNGNINGWNTSSVTNMSYMFQFAAAFNADISGWDTSRVEEMQQMFDRSQVFNHDLSGWNVSSVTNAGWFEYDSALVPEHLPNFP